MAMNRTRCASSARATHNTDCSLWLEGVTAADVVIRNNRIVHCGLGGPNDGTIDAASGIAVHVNAVDRSVPGLHKRLLFEDNEIVGGLHAISIKGAEDVIVRHNTFRDLSGSAILVGNSRRVSAHDNQGAERFQTDDLPVPGK